MVIDSTDRYAIAHDSSASSMFSMPHVCARTLIFPTHGYVEVHKCACGNLVAGINTSSCSLTLPALICDMLHKIRCCHVKKRIHVHRVLDGQTHTAY